MGRLAEVVQLIALGLLVLAAWDIARPFGLAVAGFGLLLVGLSLDPRIGRKVQK
jgi:hypothetical protein